MHQPSTSFSSSTPLRIASGQSGASSFVVPGVRPFAPYDDNGLDPAAESLSRLHEWIGLLDRYLRLPNSFQSFSVYLLGLALVFVGATLHVMVAAQIMQAKYELADLKREYAAVEQQNSELIFIISRDTNLNRIRERALAMGYVPITDREYVVLQDNAKQAAAADQKAQVPQYGAAPVQAQVSEPVQAAASADATPLRQWERFLRGEITWEPPVGGEYTTRSAEAAPMALGANGPIRPGNGGEGWQMRWQQVVEQGRSLFTKIDIR